ncbi:DUF1652 domain-containing protein [Pseudomonas sp. CDFA 602]|uniref:DUF1652 domain-containing protein n=1 Tax=Pseudomonas californiensis TaxID=2829823 RepID=UPI001E4036CD|nr:DUF1652 domain-containing protein [Pseudomonas californiensis]MCD5992835.1 DUF1652 domain-containing protein [Pseudomonas californiensis]MCD5998715.1 DUF1652 domain-containing protein [Pseudomonas californiensis]
MIACGLSTLELRNIIERAFLPQRCTCTVGPDRSMTVQVTDPESGRIELLVTGISLERLNTSRSISDLVAELRVELEEHRSPAPRYRTA